MSGESGESEIRRFLVMGSCSLLLHVLVAAVVILPGMDTEKSANIYRVEVKYLQPETRQAEEAEPEQSKINEARKEAEQPAIVDLTRTAASETMEWPEETVEIVDIVDVANSPMESIDISLTPVPLVENAIITPGGGLGSGADAEAGGGNSLFASGTGSGWGGFVTRSPTSSPVIQELSAILLPDGYQDFLFAKLLTLSTR